MDLHDAVTWVAIGLESVAGVIIVVGAVVSVVVLLRSRRLHEARLTFAHALLYALDFTIAADVLKLAIVPDWRSAAVVGAVVAVRVALTMLLLWEITHEAHDSA